MGTAPGAGEEPAGLRHWTSVGCLPRIDPACGPQIRIEPAQAQVRRVVSNSFGFGGNNCVLVFGREPP